MLKLIFLLIILSPEDFGLFGILLLTLSAFEVFTNAGFEKSIIQKQEKIDIYLNSVWTLLIIRGFILFGLIFFFSPLIASFFSDIRIDILLKTVSIVVIIRGFKNVGTVLFRKELEIKKIFLLDLSKSLPEFISTMIIIFYLNSVWALIIGTIIGELSFLIFSFILHPYKPKLELKKRNILDISNFSTWILISNILVFLTIQGDDIFVGKFLGIIALGYYQVAYQFGNIARTEITSVFTTVTFPAYSKLQNNIKQLKIIFKINLSINSFIVFLINGVIITFAANFIIIFSGSKWIPIINPLIILSCWGTIRSLSAFMSPVFFSLNKPKIVVKYQFILIIFISILIYPLSLVWNITGVSLAIFISGLITFFIRVKKLKEIIALSFKELFPILFLPFILTSLLTLLFLWLESLLLINLINVSILILIYILMYVFFSYFIDKVYNLNILNFLLGFLKSDE